VEQPRSLLNPLGEDEDADEARGEETEDDPEGGLSHVRVVDKLGDRDRLT